MQIKYSVIIPCYNEALNLTKLIDACLQVKREDIEFILVENGSLDNSREILEQRIVRSEKIKAVYVDVNQGYGYGIIQGLKCASGQYCGWMHADMQVDPKVILKYIVSMERRGLTEKGELLFIKAKRSNRHLIEYFFSFGMGLYETLLFGKKMVEVMATSVLISRQLIDETIDSMPYDFSIDIYAYAYAVKIIILFSMFRLK